MRQPLLVMIGLSILFISQVSEAGRTGHRSGMRWAPRPFEQVRWTGNFGCSEGVHDANHPKQHPCDLEFIDSDGDRWEVKPDAQALQSHLQQQGFVKVRVEAERSPRYLFGGKYIRIKKLDVLDGKREPIQN